LNSETNQRTLIEEDNHCNELKSQNLRTIYIEKENSSIIGGRNDNDFLEPRERRSNIGDCECEKRSINPHSNVDEPCPVADTDVMTNNHNGRQMQVVESTGDLIDGTTCLDSETNQQILIEEENHRIRFRSFCRLSEIFLINETRFKIRRPKLFSSVLILKSLVYCQFRSFENTLHHSSNQIKEQSFKNGGLLHVFEVEKRSSGLGLK
jgi:hypothetical protein